MGEMEWEQQAWESALLPFFAQEAIAEQLLINGAKDRALETVDENDSICN